jgi:hypothetical protein
MENEERAQLEAHYQNEIESIKGEVTRLTNLLEQVLSSKNKKGIFVQPLVKTPSIHVLGTSQNLGADSTAEQYFVPIALIPSSQAPITVDLIADGPPGNRSTDFVNYDKLSALEERLRAIEGNDWFDPMRAAEVCLVPNIIVPKNFRIPEFIKYTGLECPNTHIRSYCNKMAEVIYDDKLLIYFFQDSLTGSALGWYMRLDNIKIKTWKDLVHAFLKQYKFNLEIAPDRTILMAMEKENQESVRAYAQRWQDKATHVQPPLIDTEMVMLFANTFQSPYYEHLIGNSAQHFHEVVRIVERIEQAMKRGKIEGSTMDSRTMMRDYSGGG